MEYNNDPFGKSETLFEDHDHAVERYAQEWEVKKGRNTLFWAGGLMILGDFVAMSLTGLENYNVAFILGFDVTMASIFFALGLWSAKRPVLALSIALGLYLLLAIFMLGVIRITSDGVVFFDPDYLQFNLGGLIIKGLIVYFLIKALIAARKLEDMYRRDSFFRD